MSVTTQSTTPATVPAGVVISTSPGDGGVVQVVQLPGTQAVSATALPLPAGAATETTLATVAKDGADITSPTAMPAGGAGIRGWLSAIWTKLNGTIGVTGTFWQATQPVSIAASVAVTGPLTDTQLRATAVPVSGTVATGGLTDTQLRAAAVPVSLATAPTTPVTNAGLTNLDVALSTRLKPADTLAAVTTVGAVTAITNALPTGANTLGAVKLTDGTNTAGFASGSAAASETTVDRIKVNAELRLLDTTQAAGSQVVAGRGDQTSGVWSNVKASVLPTNAASETGGNIAALYAFNQGALSELLSAVLREQRITNYLLQNGLNVPDDLELLRAESFFQQVA